MASSGKRKAWVYHREAAPPFADLLAGGAPRQRFIRYWIRDNLSNAGDLLVHFGLKLLPADLCSDAGAAIGRFALPRFHQGAQKRARATLARLRPDLTESEREAILIANNAHQGRVMTEFSITNRVARSRSRVRHVGTEKIVEANHKGPVILIGMHLGNWEVMAPALVSIGVTPYINFVPPNSRARAWIAERVRRKAGVGFLPPGQEGVRPALKVLKSGGVVSIFCDEGLQAKIRGPLFGRKPNLEGNLAVAARLARLTGATLCPIYTLRDRGARFTFHALPSLTLPPEEKPGARLMDDITLLNAAIEPTILAHLDQWYFLDHTLSQN